MKRQALFLAVLVLLALAWPMNAWASLRGDLARLGIEVDGDTVNFTVPVTLSSSLTQEGDWVGDNGEYIDNDTDSYLKLVYDDDTATPINLYLYSSNTSCGDGDDATIYFAGEDDGSVETVYGKYVCEWDDVTSNSEDAHYELWMMVAGTLTQILNVDGTSISPETDNGVDLGKSAKEFKDLYIDGTANIDALVADTADINNGTIEAVLGGTTPKAATVTTMVANTSLTVAGNLLAQGTAVIDAGSATDVLTVANTDSDDLVFVTLNEANVTTTGAHILHAVPGSGTVTVTLSDEAGTTLTYSYQVWQN